MGDSKVSRQQRTRHTQPKNPLPSRDVQALKATQIEFRYRFWIIMAIYLLGFVAPWDLVLHLDGVGPNGAPGQLAGWGGNAHVWGLLAVLLSKGSAMSI